MTVNVSYSPIVAVGNGVLAAIPVTWPFQSPADLVVVEIDTATSVETPRTMGTHYTVTQSASGGSVTPVSAVATGKQWRVARATDITQPTTFRLGGSFNEASVEQAIDRGTLYVQELAYGLEFPQVTSPANVFVTADLTSTTAPISTPPVASFSLEVGKVYRVRARGFCRQLQAGAYGVSLRFYNTNGFTGTACGEAKIFSEGSSSSVTHMLLESNFLTGSGTIPALSHVTTGARVVFNIELVVLCTASGTLSFHYGSTSGSAQPVRLDAGALVTVEPAPLA